MHYLSVNVSVTKLNKEFLCPHVPHTLKIQDSRSFIIKTARTCFYTQNLLR